MRLDDPWTTDVIDRVLRSDVYAKKYFLGVYAIDRLPVREALIKRPCMFSFNLSTSRSSGSHWAAMVLTYSPLLTAYYFESYGLCPMSRYLKIFLRKIGCKKLCLLRRAYQSDTSYVCGLYATMFLLMYSLRQNVYALYNILPESACKRKNDEKIQCLFLNRYGYLFINLHCNKNNICQTRLHDRSNGTFDWFLIDKNIVQSCVSKTMWK